MSLASALVLRGTPGRAFVAIGAALADLTGLAAARARTQRSAILQELGRIDEALEDLRLALPVLRRAQDVEWVARALSNRSLLLTARRLFAAAEADLVKAQHLCTQHGLEVVGAYIEQNLGCLRAGQGDVPAALEHFDAAQSRYRALGLEVGSLLVDRANLLLSVRLIPEARATAEAAVRAFEQQGRKVHLPEAQLLLSTAASLGSDFPTAVAAATVAERSFAKLGRREWLALARWAHLQALVADRSTGVLPGRARRCAEELRRAGWTVPALEARVLAGRLALERGQRVQAQVDLGMASRARFAGPVDARARAWLAETLLRKARGNRRGATSALRTGLRLVEDYRATLGATELRAHVSVHRGGLARAGLKMAFEDGNARRIFLWAERGRASSIQQRPVRPPQDPELAAELADLRATMAEIDQALNEGRAAPALVRRQVVLEHRIRDHCRRSPGYGGCSAVGLPTVNDLAVALGDAALIEYVEIDGTLHAVTMVAGRVRLRSLGSAETVRHTVEQLAFALHRLTRPRARPNQIEAATAVLTRAGRTLSNVLLGPLGTHIGDRPLVVVPTGPLQSLPWSALPQCAGRPVTVAPSAALWYSVARRTPPGDRVVVVAGPGLPGALQEASAVAVLYPSAQTLTGEAARTAAVGTAMDGAYVAHVAAHGTARSDNPLFSSLLLADGPFTVYDFERLARTPHQVVLAACDTARSQVLPGDEILGLAAALLTQQTATLIAPVVAIPDLETGALMVAYHRLLRSGHSPASALACAQKQRREDGVAAYAAAASFICLGAGLRTAGSPDSGS